MSRNFCRKTINCVSSPCVFCAGIDEQGLYRIAGVNSRVQKLLSLAMGTHNTFRSLKVKTELMVLALWPFPHQIQRPVPMWSWRTMSGRSRPSQVPSSTISGGFEKIIKPVLTSTSCFRSPQRINWFFSSCDDPFFQSSRSGLIQFSQINANVASKMHHF